MGRRCLTTSQIMGVVMVLTITVNMIIFTVPLANTGYIPSEYGKGVHKRQNDIQNVKLEDINQEQMSAEEEWNIINSVNEIKNENREIDKYGQMNHHLHGNLKTNGKKQSPIHENGELDQQGGSPPKRFPNKRRQSALEAINAAANEANAKVYHLYDDYPRAPVANNAGSIQDEADQRNQRKPRGVKSKPKTVAKSKRMNKAKTDFEIEEMINSDKQFKSNRVDNQGGGGIRSDEAYKDEKAPQTFNSKYIEYFWRHPSMQNNRENEIKQKSLNGNIEKDNGKINGVVKRPEVLVRHWNIDNQRKLQVSGSKMYRHKLNVTENIRKPQVKGVLDETKHNTIDGYKLSSKKLDTKDHAGLNDNSKNPDIRYMTVYPANGQLGNHMFQLASLLGIAHSGNFIPFLPRAEFNLKNIFNLPEGLILDDDISSFDIFSEDTYNQTHSIHESKQLNTHKNWTLDGYFQSFKYFNTVFDKVKDYFKFHDHIREKAINFLNQTIPAGHVKVAIHVRRGDFISYYEMKLGRVAATAGYVRRAMENFQSNNKNVSFIVVSDDMKWCKTNIMGANVIYSRTPSNERGLDLAIISHCDHVIITVGSFGWWGGWLSGGTVIYYKNFPTPGSELDKMFFPQNYYPSDWIGLE